MNPLPRAVVFDFDGVIANTEPLHLRSYQEILAPLGIQLGAGDYYGRYLGFDDAAVFERIGEDYGLPMDANRVEALITEKSRIYETLIGDNVLFPGAAECVRELAVAIPLAIASGAFRGEIEMVLRRTGLRSAFPVIVGAAMTPSSKPAPDPYLRAVELLAAHAAADGAPPFGPAECVAVEDSRWGLQSARAAGLWCVAITHTYPADQLPGADLIVDSLTEVNLPTLEALCARRPLAEREQRD